MLALWSTLLGDAGFVPFCTNTEDVLPVDKLGKIHGFVAWVARCSSGLATKIPRGPRNERQISLPNVTFGVFMGLAFPKAKILRP